MAHREHYSRGVRTSIRNNYTAYGYSVVVSVSFGSLQVLGDRPGLLELWLFVAGAASAFTGVEAYVTNLFREMRRGERERAALIGSAFNWVSMSLGLGSAIAVGALLDGWVPWLLAPMVATTVYVLTVGIEVALAAEADE